jgi:hypothetical protein
MASVMLAQFAGQSCLLSVIRHSDFAVPYATPDRRPYRDH